MDLNFDICSQQTAQYWVDKLIDEKLGLCDIQNLLKKKPNSAQESNVFSQNAKIIKNLIPIKNEYTCFVYYFAYLLLNKGEIGSMKFPINICKQIDISNFSYYDISIENLDKFLNEKSIEKNPNFMFGRMVNKNLRLFCDKLQEQQWYDSGAYSYPSNISTYARL